jgi:restriction system protein
VAAADDIHDTNRHRKSWFNGRTFSLLPHNGAHSVVDRFMASRSYYQLAIHHPGLNKHRVIRGADRYHVEGAAAIQQRAWAEQYARKIELDDRRRERDDKRRELEDSQREAEERTAEAQAALNQLRSVLAATLRVDDRVDWTAMMQPPFSQLRPKERPFVPLPPEPVFDPNDWKYRKGFVTALIPFLAKRAEATARTEFGAAHAKWRERKSAAEATNETIYAENLRDFKDWQRREAAYVEARAKHNASVEQSRSAYQALNTDAILDYCDLVLSRSSYADNFPKEFELDYRTAARTLVVEYQLPSPNDLPSLVSVKVSRTKGDLVETELTKREFEQLYSDVVFQVALRTIHELFEADVVRALNAVIFNGDVCTLNAGTGHQENRCILSVRAERATFEAINLRNIEPRACFESLGGIASAKMLDCRAVKPLGVIDKSDDRFAAAQDVSGDDETGLDEWHELVKAISDPQDIRFLPLGTVAVLLGFPAQEKFSVTLSKKLAEAVSARGCALEPDARYGAASYRAEDEIALFRPLETAVTGAYPGAAALLQLCVMIAAADDHPTDKELEVARDFIRRNAALTSHEQQRLLVLEHYLCRNPDTAKRSLSRLAKRLPPAQRQLIGEVLVCVAGADGIISSAEWQALDRACKVLDLPPNALDEILRKLGANFDEPVVQEAELAAPGEPLPDTAPAPAGPSFTLDPTRIAAISRETAEVIGLLAAVMNEDEPKPTPKSQSVPSPTMTPTLETPAWLVGLDEKYRAIAARVVTKPAWPRDEFQQLAAEFKMMPLGVIDALNEWADETLGDFLLDGDDPVTVNASILPKMP